MDNTIKIKGIIEFDPIDRTKKHERQGTWKKIALVNIDGDICDYYCWFIKKRYNLHLQTPLRNAHVSFINDRESDTNGKWEEVKKKWNGQEVEIVLDVSPMSDEENWWLNIPNEERDGLHFIRAELGLGKPYFGLHMTIGTAINTFPRTKKGNNAMRAKIMNEEHSKYIVNLIRNGYSY